MRLRLRDEAEVDYQVLRSNDQWWEHRARTLMTAGLISFFHPVTILDLACGDGSLVFAANRLVPFGRATFCDISAPSIELVEITARALNMVFDVDAMDVEARLDLAIERHEHWDMVLLCEFLEHVPDPAAILEKARQVATFLVASSPLIEDRVDDNPEHLWAFDNSGYLELLADTGWKPEVCQNLMLHDGYYNFQVWGCSRG